jgi:hypothetical protein
MKFLIKEHRNGKFFVYEELKLFGIFLSWVRVNRLSNNPRERGGFFSKEGAKTFARKYKQQLDARKDRQKQDKSFKPKEYIINI